MNKLRILGFLVIAGVLFSCEKDIEKNNVKQDVVFGIDHVDPFVLKAVDPQPTPWDIECPEELTPATAKIVINGVEYNPGVFFVDGKLYTQSIKLDPGDYDIEQFLLLDEHGNVLMATPEEGSEFADYVAEALKIEFNVSAFEKAQVNIEVLCFDESKYLDFGFTWFYIDRIVVREAHFFGDICIEDAAEFQGSLYADNPNFPAEGFYDAPAIFKVVVKRDGEEVPNSPFSNESTLGIGEPLTVKYPDRIDVDGEVFTFELWVLVPTAIAGVFDYQHYTTFETTDAIPLEEIGTHGVVDFVIGNCNYNTTNTFDWLPAPELTSEKGFGFRIKGWHGDDIYLGVDDLGVGGNRVSIDAGSALGNDTYPLTFSFDDNTNVITLSGLNGINLSTDITALAGEPCENPNALKIVVSDSRNDGAIEWQDVELNGNPIGPFPSFDIEGTPGFMEWVIMGDFSQSFTIEANLKVHNLMANEALRAEMQTVCYQ